MCSGGRRMTIAWPGGRRGAWILSRSSSAEEAQAREALAWSCDGRDRPRTLRRASRREVHGSMNPSCPGSDGRGGGLAPWSSRAISSASVTAATMRSAPPHRRQTVTPFANTLAKSPAQPMRALDDCRDRSPVAACA